MINESLQPGDLDHLVLPLISVDEFSSKIDNQRAIVVAFYCTDRQPAEDLMRFIEGSNLDILDTEVSPAPSLEGYYVVFVEFSRNRDFPAALDEIITQVDNIADNDWQLKMWNHEDIVSYSADVLKELVILNPSEIPPDPEDDEDPVVDPVDQAQSAAVAEPVAEPAVPAEPAEEPLPGGVAEHRFWNQADVDRVLISQQQVVFQGQGTRRAYCRATQPRDFGRLILDESLNVQTLRKLLGHQYQVYMYEHGIVVQRGIEHRVLKES
jgi:hypothetical protein